MSGTVFQFPMGKGIDEGSDPKALEPGRLLVGENIQIDKLGRTAKRLGTKGLTKGIVSGGALSLGAYRLVSRGSDTAVVDSTNVNSFSPAAGGWRAVDRAPNLYVQQRPLIDSERSASYVDIAISGNLLVTVFQCGSNPTTAPIYIQVEDLTTRAKVMPATAVTTVGGQTPRVLIRGTNAVVVWTTAGGAIEVQEFSLTTFASGSGGAIGPAVATSSLFDAKFIGNTLYVAYELAAGANRIQVQSFNGASAYASVNTSAAVGGNGVQAICLDVQNGGDAWLIWSQSSDHKTYGAVFTTALATTTGATAVVALSSQAVFIAQQTAGLAIIGYTGNPNGNGVSLVTSQIDTTVTVQANSKRQSWGLAAWSKPWLLNNRWYAAVVTEVFPWSYQSSRGYAGAIAQPSTLVIEIKVSAYAAAVATHYHAATLVNQTSWFPGGLTQPAFDAAGNVYVGAAITDRSPYGFDTPPLGFYAFAMSDHGGDQHRPAIMGPNALLSGGAPAVFTGTTCFPAGFAHQPIIAQLTVGAANSGHMATGNYFYVVVYEWRDANGILHRSVPSPPVQAVNVAANGSVTLKLTCTSISGKQDETTGYGSGSASPVMIAIYRTTVGGAGAFYRLTYEPGFNVVFNDPTSENASFTDTNADADITAGSETIALNAQAQLYTNQEAEDVPPPAFLTSTTISGRTWGIAADGRTICASKNITEDPLVFPGFNEILTLTVDRDKSAIAQLDDKTVLLGPDSIDVVYGDGPDSLGNENTWQVQRIQVDVGCSNPRSVVRVPDGLVFQSTRGLEMLSSKFQLSWVGKRAMATLAAFPVITSAVLVPDQHEARWTCNASNGATGVVLVYDYLHDEWMVRKYTDASDTGAPTMPFADALLIGDIYTLVTANAQVYQEDPTTNLDGGTTWVTRDLQLGWVSPAGKLSWHRTKAWQLLGTVVGNHDLEVSVSHDYLPTWDSVDVYPAGGEGTVGPLQRIRKVCLRQKVQSTRIRIRDLTPSNPGSNPVGIGAGPIWEGIGLQVAQKTGLPRTPSVEQG